MATVAYEFNIVGAHEKVITGALAKNVWQPAICPHLDDEAMQRCCSQ